MAAEIAIAILFAIKGATEPYTSNEIMPMIPPAQPSASSKFQIFLAVKFATPSTSNNSM